MDISTNADQALTWIFHAEGGFVDDPADPGGTTRYGISIRYLRKKGKLGDIDGDGDIDADDIRALTREDAATFYISDFWNKCRCSDMPYNVALVVMDTAVHSGVRYASKLLQQMVNTKRDGKIGPKTLEALYKKNWPQLTALYLAHRATFLNDLVKANSSLARFQQGWLNRLFMLQAYLHSSELLFEGDTK